MEPYKSALAITDNKRYALEVIDIISEFKNWK